MKAKDIMPSERFFIYPDVAVTDAYYEMKELGIGHFPVVGKNAEDMILGIISDSDLLPFTAPDDPRYPNHLKHRKFRLIKKETSFHVEEHMTKVAEIKNFIGENEDHSEFLQKFYREKAPPFNLLLVINNQKEKKLRGVISWVDLLKKWSELCTPDLVDLTAQEIGTPIEEIPYLDDGNFSIGLALILKKKTTHRHLRIIQDGKLLGVFHFHEIIPYSPISDDYDLSKYYYSLKLYTDITPRFPIKERLVPAHMPIWRDSNEGSVIKRFLDSVEGKWQDRTEGLLVHKEDGSVTHFIEPFDILRQLLKKKVT